MTAEYIYQNLAYPFLTTSGLREESFGFFTILQITSTTKNIIIIKSMPSAKNSLCKHMQFVNFIS